MTADNKKTQIAIDPNPIKKIDMIDKDGFKITGSSRAEVMKK
ncbi:MAG: hypothetical protein U9R08_00970 [Nanoarchaeota archaeon]|nr:hypothetical protein [Nanoarchaeota archaeon]